MKHGIAMRGCYSAGRIFFAVVVILFIAFGVVAIGKGLIVLGIVMISFGVLSMLPLAIFVPELRKLTGLPSRLELSDRVRELAGDPQRRSEAIQAYRTETGVTSLEAERAIQEWMNRRSE
jgi:hypothetical protein